MDEDMSPSQRFAELGKLRVATGGFPRWPGRRWEFADCGGGTAEGLLSRLIGMRLPGSLSWGAWLLDGAYS